MNTYCFHLTHLLCLGLLLSFSSCQQTVNESPQILGLSVAGVPQQNITIDQQQRLITVLLPATLPSLELATNFTLSKQAYLPPYWTERNAISLTNYCPCTCNWSSRSPTNLALPIILSNKKQTSTYTFQLKSTGSLCIKPLQTPIVYDSKGTDYTITFPVENYYGSSTISAIAVTKTGSLTPNWMGNGYMDSCVGLLNEAGISLYGYRTGGIEGVPVGSSLKPGLHDLDLRLADGTMVHAEGYILVK